MPRGKGFDEAWRHSVAEAARRSCRSQRSEWQRIPAIALAAARPDEDVLLLAAAEGYWPVGPDDGLYTAYVDCASGEILDAEDPSRPASDAAVERLVADPRYLNPVLIIEVLETRIAQRGALDPHAAWRAAVMANLGLDASRPFTRPGDGPGLG